jgi:DNA polymerase-3 subunit delta'
MSTTSFSGGWKVAVIYGADRMREEAANAFLKTLEEPPAKTMFLLLTDAPEGILPTIASRSQRIDLPAGDGSLDDAQAREDIADAFARRDVKALAEKLKELKDEAADEDTALVRKAFFRTIMSFTRQLMISGKLPHYQAFRNIEAVEEAYRQCDRSINEEAVLSFMMDRMVFP